MRVLGILTTALAIIVVTAGSVGAQPACPTTPATLEVVANNLSPDGAVTLSVSGALLDPSATCVGSAATSYQVTFGCSGSGLVSCGTIGGLRPGAWVHHLEVTVTGSVPQVQTRRSVVVAGGSQTNAVAWTVYPRTFAVTEATEADLRAQIAAAESYVASSSGPALVIFARAAFPGADDPRTIDLTRGPCVPDPSRHAALCLTGSNVVVDALDGRGSPGAVVLSVGTRALEVLRLYGSDNVWRGMVFTGSGMVDPMAQVDTIALVGPTSARNRIEQSIVHGPTMGDTVSVQGGAGGQSEHDANVIVTSELTGAADKGLKVTTGGRGRIWRSCIHDNRSGGVQATLAGHVQAHENLVQHNVPGRAGNGIGAAGGDPTEPSTIETNGNVIRFAGGRGLSVVDAASGTFANDYVADNQFSGSTVESKDGAPVAAVPRATFRGVAFVCNHNGGVSGSCQPDASDEGTPCGTDGDCCGLPDSCCVTDPGCAEPVRCELLAFAHGFGAAHKQAAGHALPVVEYGDEMHLGRNAFAWNPQTILGANFRLNLPLASVPAVGNQWEHCGAGAECDAAAVAASDIVAAADATVDLGTSPGPRAGPVIVSGVSPERPRKGDTVRVFGGTFNAIEGTACATATAPTDPCSIDNQEVQQKNRSTNANRIRLLTLSGISLATLYPDAVTPTMLAFQMPFDCFTPLRLEVSKRDLAGNRVLGTTDLCSTVSCAGQDAGVPCDDGSACTTNDRCTGGDFGTCVGTPVVCDGQCLTGACDPGRGCVPKPSDAVCDDGDACKIDHCSGSGDVCVPGAPIVCVGPCLTGRCDPAGGCEPKPAGTSCRAANGICDSEERCDGVSAGCPPDAFLSAAAECRPAAGVCDLPEHCNGSSPTCPSDVKRTEECRPALGPCDVAERCNGASNDCGPDRFLDSRTVCRPATGPCDVAEACTASSAFCPADAVQPLPVPCDDGNACTAADHCQTGVCVGSGTVECPACETCEPEGGCLVAPRTGCAASVAPRASTLTLGNRSSDDRDFLTWVWLKGEKTLPVDFGDPTSGDDYALCIYDESGAEPKVLVRAEAPAGGTCGTKPCWKALGKPLGSKGFKYWDRAATQNGLTAIRLVPGEAGKARIIMRGKGANLHVPPLLPPMLGLPLRVQVHGGSGHCWESSISTGVVTSKEVLFKARGD